MYLLAKLSRLVAQTLIVMSFLVFLASPVASKTHQYPWSTFVSLQDTQFNGVQYRYRKGDNNAIERTMVFHGYYNRYKVRVSIYFECEVYNIQTGKSSKLSKIVELMPETDSDNVANWDIVPDSPLGADGWTAARFDIRNIRVTKFKMALASDPLGQLFEVYPTNEVLAKQRADAIAQEKKRQEEERERQRQQAEALKRQQDDLARQQQQAQQQYEARRQQQEAEAKKRQDQWLADQQRRQSEWQRNEEIRRDKIMRDCQARIDRAQAISTGIAQIAEAGYPLDASDHYL